MGDHQFPGPGDFPGGDKRVSSAVRLSSSNTDKAWPSCRTILTAHIEKDIIHKFHRSVLIILHSLNTYSIKPLCRSF